MTAYIFIAETYSKGYRRAYTYGGGVRSTESEPRRKASAILL